MAVRLQGLNLPGAIVDESLLLIPETAEDLDGLERSRLHLASLGCPLELWEILLLTQSGAWDPVRRTAPLAKGTAPTPAQALQNLREAEGPFVRDLRFLFERAAAPMEIGCAEVVIGAITASRSNRATALRWIADPARYRPEAEKRIASLAWRAGKLRAQLDRRRALAWEASLRPEPSSAPSPSRPVPEAPPPAPRASFHNLSTRMLADLRRAHRGSAVLREHLFQRVEPWELLLMISAEGDRIRDKIDSLLTGERSGEWIRLEDVALGLVGRAVGIRHEWATRVRELQSYAQGVSGRPPEQLMVGLEIFLAAPAGRRRALRWLESPVESAPEAGSYMKTVLSIADRYRAELESDVTVVVTTRVA
jgi:hypothetical protein